MEPTSPGVTQAPQVWLRGPLPGIQPALQPVAHALVQAGEDLPPLLRTLTHDQLWARPGGSAAIGFHVAHLAGSLTRLFTYARGEALSPEQQRSLSTEHTIAHTKPPLATLLELLTSSLDSAVHDLRNVSPPSLFDDRMVGRALLPSTTLGVLFHAAEHTTRHVGQIVTLSRVVKGSL